MQIVTAYIKEISGIALDASKAYLLETRLGPLLGQYDCNSYAGLYRKSKDDFSGKTKAAIVDAITTNETSFFRDKKPFDLLKHKLIPDLLEKNHNQAINIFSAACSTGQEVYSICIALHEILFDLTKYRIKIVGTDISEEAIAAASHGYYSNFEVNRGLLPSQVEKYFIPERNAYKIIDDLRFIATFRKANLFEPLDALGMFDIIFCRNVAIYFSKDQRTVLFNNLRKRLKPGGQLIIGSTESLMGITDLYKRMEFHGAAYYE